jgi:hypothetical protein
MAKMPNMTTREIEDGLLQRIKNDHESADSVRQLKLQDIVNYRRAYNSDWAQLQNSITSAELSNWFFVPKIFMHIQRMLIEMLSNYFGGDKFAKVTARHARGTDPMAADMMDELVSIYFDEKCKPYEVLRSAIEAGIRDGVGCTKLTWDKVTAGEEVQTNRPILQYIPVERILWDQSATSIEDIQFFIHEREVLLGELYEKQAQGVYENIDKVEADVLQSKKMEFRPTRMDEMATSFDKERMKVRIWEYWGSLQLVPPDKLEMMRTNGKNEAPQDVVCTVYEGKTMLRRPEPNPYAVLREELTAYEKLPFFIGRPIPMDDSTWGRSLAAEMRPIQREINMLRNQRRQNVDGVMGAKVLVDSNKNVDRDALKSPTYRGIVDVQGKPSEAVDFFTPQDATAGMANEEQIMDLDMQMLSGVTKQKHGLGETKRETATEVSVRSHESDITLGGIAQSFNNTLIVPQLERLSDMIIAYVTPQEVAAILDYPVAPPPLNQILKREYDFEVKAGLSATNEAVQIRNIQYAIQVIAQIINVNPQVASEALIALVEKLLPMLGVHEAAQIVSRARQQAQSWPGAAANPAQPGAAGPTAQAAQPAAPGQRGVLPQPRTVLRGNTVEEMAGVV